MQEGSPPRMRGKRKPPNSGTGGIGITPADAGKTKTAKLRHGRHRDHPRGCGENVIGNMNTLKQQRITPADAGKTNSNLGQ